MKQKENKKTKNKHKIINVVEGMENVVLLGFLDVLMWYDVKLEPLGVVQDYSRSCIHLLSELLKDSAVK